MSCPRPNCWTRRARPSPAPSAVSAWRASRPSRIGKRFELTVDVVDEKTLETVRTLADEVLSNAVIEDVVGIEVVE